MFLRQKLDERIQLKVKIDELKKCVLNNTKERDSLVKELLILIDKVQTLNIIINRVNTQSKIEIGGTSVPLSTAIEVRNTLEDKISIITSLIELEDSSLDVMSLIKQRDSILEEFKSIDMAIRLADWNIKLE